MAKFNVAIEICPCGSGKNTDRCCQPYIDGVMPAPDAESLMRSRYTAYAQENEAYLKKSWHRSSRPDDILGKSAPCKWIGLKVISHQQDGFAATVEFVARYKINGRAEKLHEISRFVFEDDAWWYVDGKHSDN